MLFTVLAEVILKYRDRIAVVLHVGERRNRGNNWFFYPFGTVVEVDYTIKDGNLRPKRERKIQA